MLHIVEPMRVARAKSGDRNAEEVLFLVAPAQMLGPPRYAKEPVRLISTCHGNCLLIEG